MNRQQNPAEFKVHGDVCCDSQQEDLIGISCLFENNEDFFEFKDIVMERNHVYFKYSYCGAVTLSSSMKFQAENIIDTNFKDILVAIGMCILPWYWMGFPCKKVKISAGHLSPQQQQFWQDFYHNVLGEYFYVNNLGSAYFIELQSGPDDFFKNNSESRVDIPNSTKPRVLVPLGGGKDSIVVHELLKKNTEQVEQSWMYVGDGYDEYQSKWRLGAVVRASESPVIQVAHDFGYEAFDRVRMTRYKPCGHPWAALVAFNSVLVSCLHGFNYIAVGNERSANYGNGITYLGREINHQYDKSFDFEQKANQYISDHLVNGLHFFSALQHLWELQITKLFCQTPKYLPIFSSCNEMGSSSRWCSKCEKCCFVFLMMSAFVEPPMAWAIFGNNLFEELSLMGVFRSLLESEKPFECIGTADEVKAAILLAKNKNTEFAPQHIPPVLAELAHSVAERESIVKKILTDQNPVTLLPPWFDKFIK